MTGTKTPPPAAVEAPARTMLPTEKTPQKNDLRDLTLLIYGSPKIGKSTWCSKSDGAIFLATEPGLNHLDVYQVTINSWVDLRAAAAELAAGKHAFRTVVIDTVDEAYHMCLDDVCRRHKMAHPADEEYGKGFALVNNEFARVIGGLARLPYGLFLTSHVKGIDVKTKTDKYTKMVPELPTGARKIVLGLCDVILYAESEGFDTRVVRTKPTTLYEAGDRTGLLPEALPLDYAAFVAAFTSEKETDR